MNWILFTNELVEEVVKSLKTLVSRRNISEDPNIQIEKAK